MVFTCAVPNGTSVSLSWIGLSGGDVNFLPSTLSPDGVRSMTATLTATERFNNTNASCDAGGFINGMGVFEQSPSALLLIQGTQMFSTDTGENIFLCARSLIACW